MTAPLRKITGCFYWPLIVNGIWVLALYEQLECHHVQLRKQTALPTSYSTTIKLGPYKATRRRCEACKLIHAR